MKTTPASVRSVAPNGDAIKKLRLEAKQTQKELVRGSTVQLRTYQRAEEGRAISPETLREIARLLKVTFEAIVENDAESDRGQVRLYNCAGKGGLEIMKLLQDRPGDVQYSFDLDPGPDEAEKIAAVVDFCKSHTTGSFHSVIPGTKKDEGAPYLGVTSASFIRAVGQLNLKLGELRGVGVNVFVGSYFYWHVALEAIEPDVEDEEYVSRPQILQRAVIAFSGRDDAFILKSGPRHFELQEYRYEMCARYNYKYNQHPDVVDKRVAFPGPDDFLLFNREFWNKQKALDRPSKAIAHIAGPANGTSPEELRKDREG